MQQGMLLFARLVRMLLGEAAIANHKLEFGDELTILGIDVRPSITCLHVWYLMPMKLYVKGKH